MCHKLHEAERELTSPDLSESHNVTGVCCVWCYVGHFSLSNSACLQNDIFLEIFVHTYNVNPCFMPSSTGQNCAHHTQDFTVYIILWANYIMFYLMTHTAVARKLFTRIWTCHQNRLSKISYNVTIITPLSKSSSIKCCGTRSFSSISVTCGRIFSRANFDTEHQPPINKNKNASHNSTSVVHSSDVR